MLFGLSLNCHEEHSLNLATMFSTMDEKGGCPKHNLFPIKKKKFFQDCLKGSISLIISRVDVHVHMCVKCTCFPSCCF